MTDEDPWPRGDRTRLAHRDLHHFAGDTLFDTVGRILCEAQCLPRKEFFESWEVARKILRRHRGGPILDLAGGHGLVGWIMMLKDRETPSVRVVDTAIPKSAERLQRALGQRWPGLASRWTFHQHDLMKVEPDPTCRVLGIHACGALTDRVLDLALLHHTRVAVLPCCHSKARLDPQGLLGWLEHDVAVDTLRALRLRDAGWSIHTATVPADITPKNRLLLGTPPALS